MYRNRARNKEQRDDYKHDFKYRVARPTASVIHYDKEHQAQHDCANNIDCAQRIWRHVLINHYPFIAIITAYKQIASTDNKWSIFLSLLFMITSAVNLCLYYIPTLLDHYMKIIRIRLKNEKKLKELRDNDLTGGGLC